MVEWFGTFVRKVCSSLVTSRVPVASMLDGGRTTVAASAGAAATDGNATTVAASIAAAPTVRVTRWTRVKRWTRGEMAAPAACVNDIQTPRRSIARTPPSRAVKR